MIDASGWEWNKEMAGLSSDKCPGDAQRIFTDYGWKCNGPAITRMMELLNVTPTFYRVVFGRPVVCQMVYAGVEYEGSGGYPHHAICRCLARIISDRKLTKKQTEQGETG